MLKKILIALVAIVIVILGIAASKSPDFRIERGILIGAPQEAVFAQVNDFHNWQAWSPWAKRDPQAKNTFEGPSSGAGATFSWEGNREVGQGRMTIVESNPNDLIRIRLDFLKPFEATNNAEFTFKSENGQTQVTWAMTGKSSLISRVFCIFMNMDKMVGGDFEKGLTGIKSIAEAAGKR